MKAKKKTVKKVAKKVLKKRSPLESKLFCTLKALVYATYIGAKLGLDVDEIDTTVQAAVDSVIKTMKANKK